jgi:hypothetical protein
MSGLGMFSQNCQEELPQCHTEARSDLFWFHAAPEKSFDVQRKKQEQWMNDA